jgi:putative transposase
VYNKLVAQGRADYDTKVKYDRKRYQRMATDLRTEFPWMKEVSARCAYESADQFHHAMQRAFKKQARWPQFKKKGQRDRFRFSHPTQFKVVDRSVRIQGLKEPIAMRERIRFDGEVRALSIKLIAGKWYATFLIKALETQQVTSARKPIVGVDLGIKTLAVLSSGEEFKNPRAFYGKQKLLARRQRQLSSKQKGSKRREIAKQRVARSYKKITDIRSASHHVLTNHLIRNYNTIVVEDLNVAGMVKNKRLAKAISDCGFGEIRRQLEYKAKWRGNRIIVADRFHASSKTCSKCGAKKPVLLLSEREFKCACGNTMDRDMNAAKNLEQYGRDQSARDLKRTEEGSQTIGDGIPVDAVKDGLSDLKNKYHIANTY